MSDCPFHTTTAQAKLSNDFDACTFLADPHPILTRARNDAPVFFDEATEHWVVTRYETIKAMLSDTETYNSVNALDPISPLDPRVPQTLEAGEFGGRPFIVNLDGDAHTETKRIMAKCCTLGRLQHSSQESAASLARCWPNSLQTSRLTLSTGSVWSFQP